jgi:hypothetical protein
LNLILLGQYRKMEGEGILVEEALVKEVAAIMSSFSVRDLDGLYNNVARSIWAQEPLEVFNMVSFLGHYKQCAFIDNLR